MQVKGSKLYSYNVNYFPPVSRILNLYTAYSLAGRKGALWSCSTALGDGTLKKLAGAERNYVSLFSFWGILTYKSIQKIHSTDRIPYKYKIALDLLFAGSSIYMSIWGSDFFADKHDIKALKESSKLLLDLFDDNGAIANSREEYSKGLWPGIKFSLSHPRQLFANKFILNCVLTQSLEIFTIIAENRLTKHSYCDLEDFIAYFRKEDNNETSLGKIILHNLARTLIIKASDFGGKLLNQYFEKEINKKIATITLDSNHINAVMKLENDISSLNHSIPGIYNEFASCITSISKTVTRAGLSRDVKEQKYCFLNVIMNYAPILLAKLSVPKFSQSITSEATGRIESYLPPDNTEEENNYTESTINYIGSIKVNQISNPENYSFRNLGEIAKMGGNEFMLNQTLNYHEAHSKKILKQTFRKTIKLESNISSSINLFSDCLQALLLVKMGISEYELPKVKKSINKAESKILNSELDNSFFNIDKIEEIKSLLNYLNSPDNRNLSKLSSKNFSLEITNYKLVKYGNNSQVENIVNIGHLKFEPGKIYAINGKNGAGKTTFLSDIVGCLNSKVFESEGEIYYPIYLTKSVPLIFCGTEPFSPPATTLFDKCSYRIPENYRKQNKADIKARTLELLDSFIQTGFSEHDLEIKSSNDKINLSTGQGKMVIIIGAILYKEYLNAPVLLMIDETLTNLDPDSSNAINSEIKRVFADSIVISVDHGSRFKTDFYDEFIKIEDSEPLDEGWSAKYGNPPNEIICDYYSSQESPGALGDDNLTGDMENEGIL
jgi:ABC-type lipoprotein export system ATPase subunit